MRRKQPLPYPMKPPPSTLRGPSCDYLNQVAFGAEMPFKRITASCSGAENGRRHSDPILSARLTVSRSAPRIRARPHARDDGKQSISGRARRGVSLVLRKSPTAGRARMELSRRATACVTRCRLFMIITIAGKMTPTGEGSAPASWWGGHRLAEMPPACSVTSPAATCAPPLLADFAHAKMAS
jgi:hypothetical protein